MGNYNSGPTSWLPKENQIKKFQKESLDIASNEV